MRAEILERKLMVSEWGLDVIGYKTPFARCQQIKDIHAAESKSFRRVGNTRSQNPVCVAQGGEINRT